MTREEDCGIVNYIGERCFGLVLRHKCVSKLANKCILPILKCGGARLYENCGIF